MPLVHKAFTLSFPRRQAVKQEELSRFDEDSSEFAQQSFCLSDGASPKQERQDGKEGRWNDQQNLKFIIFIAYYQEIFSSSNKRKNSKIFKICAKFLNDRSPAQCRSHFQKLLIKHKTVAKIRKHYRKVYGPELFNGQYEEFKAKWEESHFPMGKPMLEVREFAEIGVQTEKPFEKESSPCLHAYHNPQINFYPFLHQYTKLEDFSFASFSHFLPQI